MNELKFKWAVIYTLAVAVFIIFLLIFLVLILPELNMLPIDKWQPDLDFNPFRSVTV